MDRVLNSKKMTFSRCYSAYLDEVETHGNPGVGNHVSLFEQTRKILDHMWCAEDPLQNNPGQESDWRFFKKEMRAACSTKLI